MCFCSSNSQEKRTIRIIDDLERPQAKRLDNWHISHLCRRWADYLRLRLYSPKLLLQNAVHTWPKSQTSTFHSGLKRKLSCCVTASPWLSGWLGPEKVPGNKKKFPVLDYRDQYYIGSFLLRYRIGIWYLSHLIPYEAKLVVKSDTSIWYLYPIPLSDTLKGRSHC